MNIVRDLRVSRFLTNLWLTPYQQQMVEYFKQYSLENSSIRPTDWKTYSKKKLIQKVSGRGTKAQEKGQPDPSANPINQIIMRNVISLERHRLGGLPYQITEKMGDGTLR